MRISKLLTGLIVTLFAATAVIPAPVQADDAQSLLAKHKAFVGWQYGDGSVESMQLDRTYTDGGGKVTQHATEKRIGLAYRRDYQATKSYSEGSSTGFTGSIFWTTSANGFTVPMIGDAARYYLAIDVLFMEGSTELPASLQGTATVDGKSVNILHVTMNGAAPFDVYEDPTTGAYVQAVIDPGGSQETTIKIASYADLGPGKKIIGTWSFGDDKGQYAYAKIILNAAVAANDLHPPASAATWTFANSQPFPIRVTDSRIYVDAKVNGVQGRFILDTGAAGIFLFSKFASRVNLKTVDTSHAFGIGGITKDDIHKADTVEIGGNTLHDVILVSTDTQFKDTDNSETPDGLMGFDLFGGAIVDLSLSGGTMRITDPASGPARAPSGAYPVTVDLSTLTPAVPAKLDDKLEILATLDTGAGALVLMSEQVEHHGINLLARRGDSFLGGNAFIGGIGGYEATTCGPLARLSVGPFVYTSTEACESPNWGLHSGLLGYDFLKHFDYLFDYPHGVLYMRPHNE
ncbi:MAG: retroviral-like aspartic protease family protein [Candidatus Aquilonibacter sp.]